VDLHHNLFYSYRGPNPDDADRDRQLENNLTKALINTLSLGGEAVWRPFLDELGISDTYGPHFLLQRRELPLGAAANRRQRVLLGISKRTSVWSPNAGAETTEEGVPDAWVYGDGFAVLVESKVSGGFSPAQMQAHLARLRPSEGTKPKIILQTWGQIHGLFQSILANLKDSSSRLLVKQFIQFLEYSGMTGFTGFRREHFDYFIQHDDDDARRWVREQVDSFAAHVLANLHEVAPFYEHYDVGNLKLADSYCWVAFGPRGKEKSKDKSAWKNKEYRKVTHQSVSLHSDGLRVFVNAETQPATDRVKTILGQSTDAVAFRTALKHLHKWEPFELIVEERTQVQASKYRYTPKMRLHSSLLTEKATGDVAWKVFDETVQRLPLPYLRIERLVPLLKLLELSECHPPKAVQHVVEILQRNHDAVKLLNA
jgi:hypothetical protein